MTYLYKGIYTLGPQNQKKMKVSKSMSYTVIPTKNEGNVGGSGYKSIYYDRKGPPILWPQTTRVRAKKSSTLKKAVTTKD